MGQLRCSNISRCNHSGGSCSPALAATSYSLRPLPRPPSSSRFKRGSRPASPTASVAVPIPVAINARAVGSFSTRATTATGRRASAVAGRMASATTLEFVRATNEATPGTMSIRWYVVQWSSGVSVQRGMQRQRGTRSTSRSRLSRRSDRPSSPGRSSRSKPTQRPGRRRPDDRGADQHDQPAVPRHHAAAPVRHLLAGDRRFTNAADIRVQKNPRSRSSSEAICPSTSRCRSRSTPPPTFVLVGYNTDQPAGPAIGARMVRAQLLNATTVRIDRSIGGAELAEISVQAVELRDGSEVLRQQRELRQRSGHGRRRFRRAKSST